MDIQELQPNDNWNDGFIILYAFLLISTILSIGFSVFTITRNQLQTSAQGREFQLAYYSSEAGIECALYWDFGYDAFEEESTSEINCAGNSYTVGGSETSQFELSFAAVGSISTVTVDKSGSDSETTSLGFNNDDTDDPRRVQQGIRVIYQETTP